MEVNKDKLYEARWYATKIVDMSNDAQVDKLALDQMQILSDLLGEPMPDKYKTEEPERPNVAIKTPEFVVVKGVSFKNRGKYKTTSGMFKGLTVHYTVSGDSPKGVIGWLAEQGYGCMTMGYDGKIYIPENFDPLTHWGYHSGVSSWKGFSSVSDRFAGMEICNWGLNSKVGPYRTVTTKEGYIVAGKYQAYTPEQEAALINFCLWAKLNNKEFDFDFVAGHDELRKDAGKLGDKQDPGGSLSVPMPKFRELLKTSYAKLMK